jgi:hypothetical protein
MRMILSALLLIIAAVFGLTGFGELRRRNRNLVWFYFFLAAVMFLASMELMPRHEPQPPPGEEPYVPNSDPLP